MEQGNLLDISESKLDRENIIHWALTFKNLNRKWYKIDV